MIRKINPMNGSYKVYFFSGVRDLLPMIPGIIPFGLITGAYSSNLGFSFDMTLFATLLFFAGSAQIIAYQLIQDGALPIVIFFTAMMVNIRFMIYSAAFAPVFYTLKNYQKWILAYLLSDQAYGLCASRFLASDHGRDKLFYYSGAAISMWFVWIVCVLIGLRVGERIPSEWSLEFAIPLAFLAMLVSVLRDFITFMTAIMSAFIAIILSQLPYNLGFLIAIVGSVVFGVKIESFILNKINFKK
ncbi:AzlC family ABC transporter permease [Nitrincola nitratireducens]|uniref:Inner membrane protein YgaZ n=1 Tax=Nitrincola nitratireducens TaxID=1229521 RepID=W9UZ27_9GAMM|nr:AzlC family ABC transporter permease [Nitrincola nitratireducens]EXJ12493.1 Inner membrane protein YgaZ [Nitrincola nitratireducens]